MRLILSTLLLLLPCAAHATLIGTATATLDGSGVGGSPHELYVSVTHNVGGDWPPALFEGFLLNTASKGQVFVADALADNEFAGIAAMLSNDVAESLTFRVSHPLGTFALTRLLEAVWFSLGTNDFAGWNIGTITMTVDDIRFREEDTWLMYGITFTVRVYGEQVVPTAAQTWGAIKAMYR